MAGPVRKRKSASDAKYSTIHAHSNVSNANGLPDDTVEMSVKRVKIDDIACDIHDATPSLPSAFTSVQSTVELLPLPIMSWSSSTPSSPLASPPSPPSSSSTSMSAVPEHSIEYYKKAAEQYKDVKAMIEMGHYCRSGHLSSNGKRPSFCRRNEYRLTEINVNDGFDWYKRAAELQSELKSEAQYCVARCYHWKCGVANDKNRIVMAFEWMLSAAKLGHPTAACRIGVWFNTGYSDNGHHAVMQDQQLAFQWFQLSASYGKRFAQHELGKCYQYGCGTKKDCKSAMEWFMKASSQGYYSSWRCMGIIYAEGGCGIGKDARKGVELIERAAEAGDILANAEMAGNYAEGQHVVKDEKLAMEYYLKAAEKAYCKRYNHWSDIWCRIGYRYMEGIGVKRSAKKALEWYRKAADKQDAGAESNCGLIYQTGGGCTH